MAIRRNKNQKIPVGNNEKRNKEEGTMTYRERAENQIMQMINSNIWIITLNVIRLNNPIKAGDYPIGFLTYTNIISIYFMFRDTNRLKADERDIPYIQQL